MSDEPKGGLQFDRADFDDGAKASTTCAACGQKIWSVFYAANGRVLCEKCKADLDVAVNQGSGLGRFARAAVYGIGAGCLGSGLWYVVRAATGYEVGLIAVAVGVMVGAAVRKGSHGRGGFRYQALAMFLTYTSIVSSYVPVIWAELRAAAHEKAPTAASPGPSSVDGAPATPASSSLPASPETLTSTTSETPRMRPGRTVVGLLVALLFLFALAFAAPFLGGFDNILGIVIIGIGVYEAWKINKRQPLQITGPHPVGTGERG